METEEHLHTTDFREVGRCAYTAGESRAAALNPEVRAAIDSLPVGNGAAAITREFCRGWDDAMLATIVEA